MYSELAAFLVHIAKQRSLWKDGELWTAVAGSVVCGAWFYYEPQLVARVRANFANLLIAAQIVFGFVLSTLALYIQAMAVWSTDVRVKAVARRIIDWHVWTVVCLLGLTAYTYTLWVFGRELHHGPIVEAVEYAFLAFLVLYCGGQILNHTLTVWWAFTNSDRLRTLGSDIVRPGESD